jgi:hypothetical protein
MKVPQFTLRDLFWLTLVCAFAVGWWSESQHTAALLRRDAIQVISVPVTGMMDYGTTIISCPFADEEPEETDLPDIDPPLPELRDPFAVSP